MIYRLLFLCVCLLATNANAQKLAKIKMPELAFLQKLEGKWICKEGYKEGKKVLTIDNVLVWTGLEFETGRVKKLYPSQPTIEMPDFLYEKFSIEKNEIDVIEKPFQNRSYTRKLALTFKGDRLFLTFNTGRANIPPRDRLPAPGNICFVLERQKD